MNQPVEEISGNEIERIILRDYSMVDKNRALEILKKYNGDSEKGTHRVWASVLKISNSNVDELNKDIQKALIDYRDLRTIE